MPWILCPRCGGSRQVPADPDEPDGEQEECGKCKDSSVPGRIYVEFMA